MPTLQFLLLRTIQGRADPFSARSYQQTCCIARVVPYWLTVNTKFSMLHASLVPGYFFPHQKKKKEMKNRTS